MPGRLPVIDLLLYGGGASYRGGDRVDVTRQGALDAARAGRPLVGEALAPPAELLRWSLAERTTLDRLARDARQLRDQGDPGGALLLESDAARARARFWTEYTARYRTAMIASYRADPTRWTALLDHGRRCCQGYLTLVCYCREAAFCHRTLAGTFLAKVGGARVVFGGECEPPPGPVTYVHVCTRGARRGPPVRPEPVWG